MRVLLLVVVASCTVDGTITAQQGPCPALEQHTFASVDQLECGLGPDGVSSCTWHLTFDASDQYEWQHSDVGGGGHVTCDGARVTPDSDNVSATYDDASHALTWDGEVYLLEQ
jgi:hypothetical protein